MTSDTENPQAKNLADADAAFRQTQRTLEMRADGDKCICECESLKAELAAAQATIAQMLVAVAKWSAIETLMTLGDVELIQREDGGFGIHLEPAENIAIQYWTGDTPDEVLAAVIKELPKDEAPQPTDDTALRTIVEPLEARIAELGQKEVALRTAIQCLTDINDAQTEQLAAARQVIEQAKDVMGNLLRDMGLVLSLQAAHVRQITITLAAIEQWEAK